MNAENLAKAQEKESPPRKKPKTILSSHNSHPLSSLPNGRLPIGVSRKEITWGCVKLGETYSKDFVVENRSSSRLEIQLSLSSPVFRLCTDGSKQNYTDILKIILHRYEIRGVSVIFSPKKIGAAVGDIEIISTDPGLQQRTPQLIGLNGYGGFGNIIFCDIPKGTPDMSVICLGNIHRALHLSRSFNIKNTGNLATFTYFELISNNYGCRLEVSPKTCILRPRETKDVVLSVRLYGKDAYNLRARATSRVILFGTLFVRHGTEANRALLREACKKSKEKNLEVPSSILQLVGKFPGELIPSDSELFAETATTVDDVYRLVHTKVITVTLEQDRILSEAEPFWTICDNAAKNSSESCKIAFCEVTPRKIILTPPGLADKIFLTNTHLHEVYFKANATPEGLQLQPREGKIDAKKTSIIDVLNVKQCRYETIYKVKILVYNEHVEANFERKGCKYDGGRFLVKKSVDLDKMLAENYNCLANVQSRVKEDTPSKTPKSILSSHNTPRLSRLQNGKLPIGTSRRELVWGCVNLGETYFKEFIIANRSSSRLQIQLSVSNQLFQLCTDGSKQNYTDTLKVVLYPYESRCLDVTFSPKKLGGAIGTINFISTDPHLQPTTSQYIALNGYGGFGNVLLSSMPKDTTSGKFVLSLGNIHRQLHLSNTFNIKNTGSLATFTYFNITSNKFNYNIKVSPKTCTLRPGEAKDVVVSVGFKETDFYNLRTRLTGPVIDIANLQVRHGTEANRALLRQVCQKTKLKNLEVPQSVLKLAGKFPGEIIPSDSELFGNTLATLDDVYKLLHKEQITVTVEMDPILSEAEPFWNICDNAARNLESCRNARCQVEPTKVILTPPDKLRDRIFVTNTHFHEIYFKVGATPHGLDLKPQNGTIYAKETLIINVKTDKQCRNNATFKVNISVYNEHVEVDVKIMYV